MKGEQIRSFVKQHSSTILTFIGAGGVVATSVLAVKATPKAISLLSDAKIEKGDNLTKKEIVKTAAPVYIPAISACAATLACIFGANALNKKQQAALISAYGLVNGAYKDYRNKLKETLGDDTDTQIRDAVVRDKAANIEKARTEDDIKLIFDMRTGEYFQGTVDFVELDGGLECYIIDF